MGLVGAYLLVFPHAIIVVFRFFFWIPECLLYLPLLRYSKPFGIADWKAWWVVVFYLIINNLYPFIMSSINHGQQDVGYFAHFGGATAGLLMALALRTKTDSERVSQVQAIRTDVKGDLGMLTLAELTDAAWSSRPRIWTWLPHTAGNR